MKDNRFKEAFIVSIKIVKKENLLPPAQKIEYTEQ